MRRVILAASLLLFGCANAGVGTAVAALGIAGAGLTAYCVAGGNGCSPALVAYGAFITTEATNDAIVLESGQTTVAKINEIIQNLNTDLDRGRALAGLTPQQQAEVAAITAAISSLLPLVEALVQSPPTASLAPRVTQSASVTVKLPKLSAQDRKSIANMRQAIAAKP